MLHCNVKSVEYQLIQCETVKIIEFLCFKSNVMSKFQNIHLSYSISIMWIP